MKCLVLVDFFLIYTTEQLSGVVLKLSHRVLDSGFPRVRYFYFLLATHAPQRKGNTTGGPPLLFNIGIQNQRGCCESPNFGPNWECGIEPDTPGSKPRMLHFTLIIDDHFFTCLE